MAIKKKRDKYLSRGMCENCGAHKPIDGILLCPRCWIKRKEYRKTWRLRYGEKINEAQHTIRQNRKASGLCQQCGHKLHIEADAGCVTCINCRDRRN